MCGVGGDSGTTLCASEESAAGHDTRVAGEHNGKSGWSVSDVQPILWPTMFQGKRMPWQMLDFFSWGCCTLQVIKAEPNKQ